MRCQQCNVNRATVNMAMQVNNERMNIHLCSSCFNEIKGQMNQSGGFAGDMSSHPFFQGQMNNQGQGQTNQGSSTRTQEQPNKQKDNGLIDELGTNLTDRAKSGQIDPVIGRDNEVKRMIEILNRRNKNNPVLIGEPGVGKTAIAEGLALKMVEGSVPTKLLNKEVYLLDVASLVANTGIRGQFEERMKQLIDELQNNPDIIVFI